MKHKITDFFIYNNRYLISSVVIALILITTLLITGLHAPGGLAQTEINSVVESHEIGFGNILEPENIIGLPFKLIQKISFGIFGLSLFSIKLPSLFITALAAIALFFLISVWTDRRSAILSTIIILISGRWLILSQLGNQTATIIGLSIILVATLTYLTDRTNALYQTRKRDLKLKLKLISLLLTIFFCSALLFYFPMGIYLIFIISLTMLLHPFIRLSLKRLNKLIGVQWYIVGLACLIVLITPLLIGVVKNINLATNLLNINNFNFELINNIKFTIREFLDFSPSRNSLFATPWFNLSAVVLIAIGIFREARTSYKPRSSIILMWLFSALVISLFSQQSAIIMFIPLSLSLAMGLDYIITSWYRIFPRNPIARFVGLVPIITLLACLVLYNITTYVESYHYQPQLADQFSIDLNLLNKELKNHLKDNVILITSQENNETRFYEILALQNKNLKISNKFDPKTTDFQIATHRGRDSVNDFYIKKILTSHFSKNADRFYLYKKIDK